MLIPILLVCLLVGVLVGATGIGGILMPPALMLLGGVEAHQAMGTALASFLPLALVGIYRYAVQTKVLSWPQALPLCAGGLAGTGPGALLGAQVQSEYLVALLALLIIFCGVGAFRPPSASGHYAFWHTGRGIFLIGLVTGVLAGLTGAGGPVLTIPFMIVVGFAPLSAVALSFAYQVATSLSGTVGNALVGNILWALLLKVCLANITGTLLGLLIARHLPQLVLRRCIGALCCALGLFLILRTIL